MSRTTIALPDDLLRLLKRRAADEGTTLKEIVARLLREALGSARRSTAEPFVMTWRTVDGRGLQPGVDLDDRNALWDRMDGRDGRA